MLVGHSLGGTVAAAFACAYPERVAGLVLLAAVTHPWKGALAWHYNVGATPVVGAAFARAAALPIGEVLLEMGARDVFLPQAMPADYLARAGIRLLLRPAEFVANAQDVAVLRAFVTAQVPHYRELTMPTVVLTGDADVTVSPTLHSRAIAAMLPDARLVMLPGDRPHAAPRRDRRGDRGDRFGIDAGARGRRCVVAGLIGSADHPPSSPGLSRRPRSVGTAVRRCLS